MSKFILNSSELEFNPYLFNYEPVFDPEPLDENFDRYCDNLVLQQNTGISSSSSGEEDNDSSIEFDVKKEIKNEFDDDDENSGVYSRKDSKYKIEERKLMIKRFGRKPRPGYYLSQAKGILYEKCFTGSKNIGKRLKPLKSFLGNGVEVEVRDSLIPGAGKGLFLSKTNTNQNYIPKDTFICAYDGVFVHTKEKITKYLETQEGNDYLWQGKNSRRSHFLVDAQDPESSYGRFANKGFKNNNTEITFANVSETCLRIILKSTRKSFLQHEIYTGYGAEYFKIERHRTNPEFLAQAWKFYKIPGLMPTFIPNEPLFRLPSIPEIPLNPVLEFEAPVPQMDLAQQNPTKKTFEELRVLRVSKKRQALQIELEIIDIDEEMLTFKK